MEIYKIQAKKTTCEARTQRVLREQAHAQRVKEQQLAAEQQASPINTPTPNVIPWSWSGLTPRHGHWFVARNSNHIPGWGRRYKPPHSKHPTTTSDTYLNSRLHATHDGDTGLHSPVLPTTSSVTNFPLIIPLWSCICSPQQWHRQPTWVPPSHQASKIQGHVE